MKTRALAPILLGLWGSWAPASGCSSHKNYEERANTPEAMAQAAAAQNCVGTCLEDPGSQPIDCAAAEAGFEFDWAWPDLAAGFAPYTYTYNDNTTDVVLLPGEAWQPQAEAVDRCGPSWAVRFKGGPFTEYGGGFGHSFCTAPNPCTGKVAPAVGEFAGKALDLSAWDGVAIWVRRGPNGQPTLRLAVTEKNSSEDLNTEDPLTEALEESKYCSRFRLCGCPFGTPCSAHPADPTSTYCFDPALNPSPTIDTSLLKCGESRCNQPNSSTTEQDPLFSERACTDAVTSDGLNGKYCYNPGQDPEPPAKRRRCGNPFAYPVRVTTDWQLIKVPFGELRQADERDVAEGFDVRSVKQLVFTYSTGWVDFYVSNVGFYRKAG